MRAIALDFERRRNGWPQLTKMLLLFACLLMIAGLYRAHVRVAAASSDDVSQLASLQRPVKTEKPPADTAENAASNRRLQQAEAILKKLNLPWAGLLDGLEVTRQPDIDLLEVLPDAASGKVTLTGQAADLQSVFAYMDRLKNSGLFAKVTLSGHEKSSRNGLPGLKFTIVTDWQGAHG